MESPVVKLNPNNSLSRRDLLVGSAVSATLVCAGSAAEPSEKNGWIDAHVHVWTPDTKSYPLDKSFKVANMRPPSFTPEELFAFTKPSGVDRIVLIQMSFYHLDNRYMLDAMRENPGVFGGVGIVDHHDPNVAEKMKALATGGVRGFRLHSRGNNPASGWPDDDGMANVWRAAAENQLAVCPLINAADLLAIDLLCKRFPDTKVVIDHFARVGVSGTVEKESLDMLCDLAKHKNTYVKTSAFYALGKKQPPYTDLLPMIRRVCDAYGPERLMWASDCPYQVQGKHTYEASIALIRDHCDFLSDGDKKQLLQQTAQKLFFAA